MFQEAMDTAKEADTIVLALGIEPFRMRKDHQNCRQGYSTNYYCGQGDPNNPQSLPFWQNSSCPDGYTELEGHDRLSIDLPLIQHKLAAAMLKLHKPTVILLFNGGQIT